MSLNNILYLEEKAFVSNKVDINGIIEIYSLRSELNQIANKFLTSINEYRKFARKELGLKNKIPLYLSSRLLLFTVKSEDTNYWINYFNILKICYSDNIIIIFKNGDILELHITKTKIIKELEKINKVLNYINSL
jgi:hypothetical protein